MPVMWVSTSVPSPEGWLFCYIQYVLPVTSLSEKQSWSPLNSSSPWDRPFTAMLPVVLGTRGRRSHTAVVLLCSALPAAAIRCRRNSSAG